MCDLLVVEQVQLDPLFGGGAREALERRKEYLEGMVSICQERQREIVRLLPLLQERVEWVIRSLQEGYAEGSEVGRIAGVVDYDEEELGALEFEEIRVRLRVDRLDLTELVGGPPMVVGVGSRIATRELLHFATKIVLAIPKAKETQDEPAVAEVLEATRRLKQRNHQPHTILVPLRMFEWLHTSMGPQYENGDPYVAIDEEARCRIVWIPDEWDIERIIILSQDCGEWVRRRSFGIEVSGEEGMEIEFLIAEEICFDLRKVEALEVV